MANTAAYVTTGKAAVAGGIYRAAVGATLPTDATTALDTSVYTPLGYVSDSGLTEKTSKDVQIVKDWRGDPVCVIQSGKVTTFSFELLEVLNVEVQKTIYGEDNVSGSLTAGIAVESNNDDSTEYVYVIDQELRGGVSARIVIPDGVLSELGDISYTNGDAIKYPLTITALADDDGVSNYKYYG